MRRITSICRLIALLCCCGLAEAQATLGELEQAATQAQQDWFGLASVLDSRLTRMLPCDSSVTAVIEETHKASTARLVALLAYTQGVAEQASQDVAMALQIQRSQQEYLAGQGAERIDTEQERAGVESQMVNLAESVRKRVSLTVASDELRALESAVRDRANLVAANVAAAETVLPRFEGFVQVLQKRAALLRKQITMLEDERVKWNGYYVARLARALVECTETGR